ncbi:hypothetical protein HDZ31DRAFT_40806, partial [Schizophyllum fasciatum]
QGDASASSPSSAPTGADTGGRDVHVCMECGKNFSRRGALEAHINTHTGAKPYTCSFPGCSSAFAARSNLLRHHRVHGKEFAQAAASPGTGTVFEAPIVNNEVVAQDHPNVQWMTPNQPSRTYTRYNLPTTSSDTGTSAAGTQPAPALNETVQLGTSIHLPSPSESGEVMEYVDPREVLAFSCCVCVR